MRQEQTIELSEFLKPLDLNLTDSCSCRGWFAEYLYGQPPFRYFVDEMTIEERTEDSEPFAWWSKMVGRMQELFDEHGEYYIIPD